MSISLSQFGFMIDIHDFASHGCDSNSFLLGGSGMASPLIRDLCTKKSASAHLQVVSIFQGVKIVSFYSRQR